MKEDNWGKLNKLHEDVYKKNEQEENLMNAVRRAKYL
jgi:hypothetical protein